MLSSDMSTRDPLLLALKFGQLFVRLASLFTFVTGVLLILQPILRHSLLPHPLVHFGFKASVEGADFTNLLTGLVLTYLAYELLQRKRIAWFITLGASSVSVVAQFALGAPTVRAFFLLFVIVMLLASRHLFVVKAPVTHLAQGLRAFVASIILALAYGTIGFWLLDKRDFGRTFSLTESFENTLQQYWPFSSSDLMAHSRFSHWFLNSLTIVGIATILYCLYSILRPLEYTLREVPAEREAARKLLETYGGGIDDFFKLWPHDKSYFFASDKQAFIAYGVARGVAICLADPEGKPESIEPLLAQFRDFCFGNGWLIAFIAASDKHASLFKKFGFSKMDIGADAVIDTQKFLNETVRNKYFRNIVNRFQKGNSVCERHLPPHDPQLISELRSVSNDWLKIPGRKEWTFLTGRFQSRYFRETPLFVLRDEKGKALAFANEIPSFKAGEATIDLMRHRRDIPKNAMDYLFIELIRQLAAEGYQQFNLGLSPVVRQDSEAKRFDFIYIITRAFVSAKGLHQYKSKFDPTWEPRFVYYAGDVSSAAQIGLALQRLSVPKRTSLR